MNLLQLEEACSSARRAGASDNTLVVSSFELTPPDVEEHDERALTEAPPIVAEGKSRGLAFAHFEYDDDQNILTVYL
jgi:hypothetical protein